MEFESDETMDQICVFGYGSLTWKPGMEYTRRSIGYIKGFKRRFWQGNTTHRGTKESVGRVATLVPDKEGVVWGVAYEICGRDAVQNVINYLCVREMKLGGYSVITTPFQPRGSSKTPQNVIVYMATQTNDLYIGDDHIDQMAMEIHTAKGAAGTNSEYVTRLADFVRDYIPEDNDFHLFELDSRLRQLEANSKNNAITEDIYSGGSLEDADSSDLYEDTDSGESEDELFIEKRQS